MTAAVMFSFLRECVYCDSRLEEGASEIVNVAVLPFDGARQNIAPIGVLLCHVDNRTVEPMQLRYITLKLPNMPNPHYAALLYAVWGAAVAAGLDEEARCEHDGQIHDDEIHDLFAVVNAHRVRS